MSRPARHHHHVYVVELEQTRVDESASARPTPTTSWASRSSTSACPRLYPDLRFDRHKAGIQANRFVFEYGLRLLPALYEVYNPMPDEAAREMEVELAIGLREAGFGVWQA